MRQQNPENVNGIWKAIIAYYGTSAQVAELLGVTRQSVQHYKRVGAVPAEWARAIHLDTGGALRADALCPKVFAGICA